MRAWVDPMHVYATHIYARKTPTSLGHISECECAYIYRVGRRCIISMCGPGKRDQGARMQPTCVFHTLASSCGRTHCISQKCIRVLCIVSVDYRPHLHRHVEKLTLNCIQTNTPLVNDALTENRVRPRPKRILRGI